MINITNENNMELMKRTPDNYYSLSIVDPPYGINVNQMNMGGRNTVRPTDKKWDSEIPTKEYFDELFRVSKKQIIWGGNYFPLRPSRGFVIWDKGEMMYGRSFAECEYAWLSIDCSARIYKLSPTQLDRIHPTQKPVKLYEWLLLNYAKQSDKIIDTHGGSMSLALAVHNVNVREQMDLSLDICELDKEYFDSGLKRYQNHIKQMTIFDV